MASAPPPPPPPVSYLSLLPYDFRREVADYYEGAQANVMLDTCKWAEEYGEKKKGRYYVNDCPRRYHSNKRSYATAMLEQGGIFFERQVPLVRDYIINPLA